MDQEAHVALAQQAYRFDSYPDFPAESLKSRDIRAMRTGTREQSSATSLFITAAKLAAIVLVVIAALSFARIALTSATVSTMIESDAISGEIADARSTGVSLEMEQSVLSNTSAIKQAATRLGMAAPYEVGTIELAPDVVATDAAGNLSLSGTVSNFVAIQG